DLRRPSCRPRLRDAELRIRAARREEAPGSEQRVDAREDLAGGEVAEHAVERQPVVGVPPERLRAPAAENLDGPRPADRWRGGRDDREDRRVERALAPGGS